MKNGAVIIILFLLTLHTPVSGQQEAQEPLKAQANDSTEYRLIIMDLGFDSWLATRLPRDYYSNNYYRIKNLFYVSEWNRRYTTSSNPELYDNYIDYDPDIDYGIDINYRLYYYFRYFEETNHVKLLLTAN
jgi:hypothetical protein